MRLKPKPLDITRRDAIKAVTGVAAAVAPFVHINAAPAADTLRILQWSHFVPGYDNWFNTIYTKDWGKANDTRVVVDNVDISLIDSYALGEVLAREGHDLVLFLAPPAIYEPHVIDMNDVYAECASRHGKPIDLAVKSTYNPRTKRYFAFSDSFVPDPVNYRADLWSDVGMLPDTWENVRVGGRSIKERTGIPVGIGLSAELDSAMALRAIMYSFGAHEQDQDCNLTINSPQTLEVLKFVKALFEEAMVPEVLAWYPASNNRKMLLGRSSLILNAISATRAAENNKMNIHEKIGIARPPAGPVRRMSTEHVMNCYVIWKFSRNIDGAKKFLIDYIDKFRQAFLASEFYNFPCFASTVPNIKQLVSNDTKAVPASKYAVLTGAIDWSTNVGYPGYSTAAIADTFHSCVINTMFSQSATGAETPEDALKIADIEMRIIWAKWKARGLI